MKSSIHELKNLITEKMSKSKQTIRRTIAIIAIFFAVAATSCQKENDVTPDNGTNTPTTPVIPVTPVTPAVSMKPRFILTTENGSAVRKQAYGYDAQGKLNKYESSGATSDSVTLSSSTVTFKRLPSGNPQFLSFNADKTFKSLFISTSRIDFNNNQTKLSTMTSVRSNGTTTATGEFAYINNNLSTIGAEIRIDINYFDNLPYQKGINEIPVSFNPVKYYKILEQEMQHRHFYTAS